jgi:hypothetical protein
MTWAWKILPHMTRSFEWSLSFRVSNQRFKKYQETFALEKIKNERIRKY